MVIAVVSATGIVLSVAVCAVLSARESDLIQTQFRVDAQQFAGAIETALVADLGAVHSLRAFYNASREVERHEFREYSQTLLQRHAHLAWLAWMPRIPADARDHHEQALRREGLPQYRLLEKPAQDTVVPAAPREVHYPIEFVEPMAKTRRLLGWDLASRPEYLAAIRRAADRGQVATVVEDAGTDACRITALAAVYRRGEPDGSSERHGHRLQGLVAATYSVREIVAEALEKLPPGALEIRLVDRTAGLPDQVLCVYRPSEAPASAPVDGDPGTDRTAAPIHEAPIMLADRTLIALASAMPGYGRAHRLSDDQLLMGLAL
jgi:CHASE1-domain containing sensor protein